MPSRTHSKKAMRVIQIGLIYSCKDIKRLPSLCPAWFLPETWPNKLVICCLAKVRPLLYQPLIVHHSAVLLFSMSIDLTSHHRDSRAIGKVLDVSPQCLLRLVLLLCSRPNIGQNPDETPGNVMVWKLQHWNISCEPAHGLPVRPDGKGVIPPPRRIPKAYYTMIMIYRTSITTWLCGIDRFLPLASP